MHGFRGRVVTRRSDKEMLLGLVRGEQSVGNVTLQRQLGWKAEKYWRIRDNLIDDGLLERGKGMGGSVRRPVAPDYDSGSSKTTRSSPESELYAPLLDVLKRDWIREMRIEPDQIHFEITAKQGKKPTGGTWTRPDITAVSVRSFQYLPTKYLDVWTFEVKPVEYLDVTAVFEAASHASRATRSYALLEIPETQDERAKEIVNRCERELCSTKCRAHHVFGCDEFCHVGNQSGGASARYSP